MSDKSIEIQDGETIWTFDREFMESNWTCIWGQGCHGIEKEKDAASQLGCCSVGAQFTGEEEAMFVAAMASMVDPKHMQFSNEAQDGGVFNADRTNTRVIEGGCIFLNRPGFSGGAGCSLDLAAAEAGESRLDWKPSVCWELPSHIDWKPIDNKLERATVRAWRREDWGDDGDTMAWCCTDRNDGTEAFVGTQPVVDYMAEELQNIVGTEVYVELKRRLT